MIFQTELKSSVNCIAWAPFEYGLILAAGTIDGRISVFNYNKKDGAWTSSDFVGHFESVNGLSWAPAPLQLSQQKGGQIDSKDLNQLSKRLASCGNDKLVKIWEFKVGESQPNP